MGDWEKTRYRNVKRNYEALLALGNRTSWGRELGSRDSLYYSGSLTLRCSSPCISLLCAERPGGVLFFCVRAGLALMVPHSRCHVLHPLGPPSP